MEEKLNNLRKARFEKRCSQIRLFKKTGIWPSRISHLENDHVKATKTEKKKLAAALDWEQNILFPEDDFSPRMISEVDKKSQMEGTKEDLTQGKQTEVE